VQLENKTYTARVNAICDQSYNCTTQPFEWSFTIASSPDVARGDTRSPPRPSSALVIPTVSAAEPQRTVPERWLGLAALAVLALSGVAIWARTLERRTRPA